MENQQLICPSCGAAIKPGAKFCVKCGQPISPVAQPDVPRPQTPQPPQAPAGPILAHTIPPAQPLTPPGAVPPAVPPAKPAAPVAPAHATPVPPPVFSGPIPSTPAPMPSRQGTEQVQTVVGMVSRKTGVFSSMVYHLVVTSTRLIFALQTKEMQAADVNAARQQAKAEGKKLLGQIGAQMATRSGDKYLSWQPDAILAETPQNFMIPLTELMVIETYSGDFEDNAPDTMVVKTLSDKLQFTINNALGVQRQLKSVLGNRVK